MADRQMTAPAAFAAGADHCAFARASGRSRERSGIFSQDSAACAAASLATGTRNGLQLT